MLCSILRTAIESSIWWKFGSSSLWKRLTLGQALQVCCSVVQSYLSNCCQNCAAKPSSLCNVMWIICYPLLLFSKTILSHGNCISHSVSILSGTYTYPFLSTNLSKMYFAIASSIPWTGLIPIAWLSALNSCTRFPHLVAWCKAW